MTKLIAISLAAIACAGCFEVTLPTTTGDPESYCSNMGLYYCNTTLYITGLPSLPNGASGYCMAGENFSGIAGWSVVYTHPTVSGQRATPVGATTNTYDAFCHPPKSVTDPPHCISTVRCTRH